MEKEKSIRKKVVTLKDVAKQAGVSIATASLALNKGTGHERIGEETKNRILKTAHAMSYRTNYVAQALKSKKNMQVGVVFPNIEHPFTSQFISGLESSLRQKNYDLLLLNMTNSTSENAITAIRKVEVGGIDGLVILSMPIDLQGVLATDIPVVFVDEKQDQYPSVCFDAKGSTQKLTRFFLDRGIQKIAYIGTRISAYTYQDRETGYIKEMKQAGITNYADYMFFVEPTLQGGIDAYNWFIRLDNRPEAIITFTDNVAHSMLLHMIGAGYKIPEDVQVASIDDVELSRMMVPSLTCVHVPIYEMGQRAGERMLELLCGGNSDNISDIMPVNIIERQSTIETRRLI